MYLAAFARPPSDVELQAALAFLEAQAEQHGAADEFGRLDPRVGITVGYLIQAYSGYIMMTFNQDTGIAVSHTDRTAAMYAAWDRQDALKWWSDFGPDVRDDYPGSSASTDTRTLAIDLGRRS